MKEFLEALLRGFPLFPPLEGGGVPDETFSPSIDEIIVVGFMRCV